MDYHYPYYSLMGAWSYENGHYGGVEPEQRFYQRLPEERVVQYMHDHLVDLVQDDLG